MIHHCYTAYTPKDSEALRRNALAQMSWKAQPWSEIAVKDEQLKRLWKEEGKALPFIKDMFDLACEGRPGNEIVVYTNCDIHVRSDASMGIACALQDADACYAYRCDFKRIDRPLDDLEFVNGTPYSGSDLVAFRVSWWMDNRDKFPDMLLGMEAWDPCIRTLIEETNLGRWTVLNGVLAHEKHASFWEASANRYRFGGQKYNLQLAKQFLMVHGVDPKSHGIP